MENFGQIRKAIESHKQRSNENRPHDDEYRVDRYDASRYFAPHPKWGNQIREYFQELHNRNEEVVHVDVCGRATAEKLGADKSYCFSLKTPGVRKIVSEPNNVFIDGDIFNTEDFSNLIERLKQDNISPALVTFEPMAGLNRYEPMHNAENPIYENVTYGQLEKRLEKIVAILKPGGYVYLEKPFQSNGTADFIRRIPQKQWEITLNIKKLAERLKCKIKIATEISGPYFLIQKPLKKVNKEF